MGDPPISPTAFSGPLWDKARTLLQNDRSGELGTDPGRSLLSTKEYRELVKTATSDKALSADEKALLDYLANPTNVRTLSGRLKAGTFDPTTLPTPATADVTLTSLMERGLAMRELRGLVYAKGKPDFAALQQLAAATKVDLSTPEGRQKAVDGIAQHAQGMRSTCNATSLLALATYAGKDGLKGLCQAVVADRHAQDGDKAIARDFLVRLDGKTDLTLADLAKLATALYRSLDETEDEEADVEGGANRAGVQMDTMYGFIINHQADLKPVLANGDILGIDLKIGGSKSVHAVARIKTDRGEMIFDPANMADGHHLRTSTTEVGLYKKGIIKRAGL